MKTFLDCVPCFLRQALDAVRMVTDDVAVQEDVLREVLKRASEMSLSQTPPEMGREIHRITRRLSADGDPYRAVKVQFNETALRMYPGLKQRVRASSDPFETAARLAIAGNIIDFGLPGAAENIRLEETIEDTLERPFAVDSLEAFRDAAATAEHILYLADNAGEIVFDRILIEELGTHRVTVAVKGGPIINDATVEDASFAGLDGLVEVIDNGSDAPGTILADCSDEFRSRFRAADLVIAKGQGNYETLSDVSDQDVFFLLKAKCPVIAKDIGCEIGGIVVTRNQRVEQETRAAGCVG